MFSFFGGIWGKLAIIASAILGVLAVLAYVRQSGRNAERLDTMDETNEIIKKQRKAAANAPSTKSGVIDRLHDGDF